MNKLSMMPKDVSQSFTGIQTYIQEVLADNDASVEEIIKDIVDVSKTAKMSTPTWDVIDDPKTRLNAKKLLLELSWVYKGWKSNTNINFDFSSMLFDGQNRKDNKEVTDTATVIDG